MSVKLSTKDMRFIKPLFLYLNLFHVVPWYSFQRNEFVKPGLFKLYGVFCIFLKIILFFYATMDDSFNRQYVKFAISQKWLFGLMYISLMSLSILTFVKSSFYDWDNWKKLFQNFNYLDVTLQTKGLKERKFFQNFYLSFLLKHSLVLGCYAYGIYVTAKLLNMPILKMLLWSGFLDAYFQDLVKILISTVIEAFRVRYKELNGRVERSNVHELVILAQHFRVLSENVHVFNRLFGYQVLLIIFNFGLQIVSAVNFAFWLLLNQANRQLYHQYLITNLLGLVITFYLFLDIVLPISSTMEEAKKFVDLLHKRQDDVTEGTEKMNILKRLCSYSKNFIKDFTAAGFFKINKSTVFSVVAQVATYLIITIQINGSLKQQSFVLNSQ